MSDFGQVPQRRVVSTMSSSAPASTPPGGLPTTSIIAIVLGSAALIVLMVTCGTVIYLLFQRAGDLSLQPPAIETVHEASNQSPVQQKEPPYIRLSTILPALPEDPYMAYSRVKTRREASHQAPVYELNSPGPSGISPVSLRGGIWQQGPARDDELHMFEVFNRMGTRSTQERA